MFAGVLMVLLAAAHSILGERLIFARLRQGRGWKDSALGVLEQRRWWALRGTWHLVTILAIGLGVMLLAAAPGQADIKLILGTTVLVAAVY